MGKKVERMTFVVGDEVFWSSQAGGRNTRKDGVVLRVVPAHEQCRHEEKEKVLYSLQGGGGEARDHESYLVLVPGRTENSKPLLYHPVVSLLKKKC